MRLRDGGEAREAALADLTGVDTFAGKLDQALAELDDIESWNLPLRYISTRNRSSTTGRPRFETGSARVREVLDNAAPSDIPLQLIGNISWYLH
jgi:hypothetical protein